MENMCQIVALVVMLGTCGAREFRVAWMAPDGQSGRDVTSFTSVNALKLGLNSVTANPNIMNGHTIRVKYFSTDCSAQQTMTTALQFQRTYNLDVIIGPPCTEGLRTVSQLAAFWNLPVFSWHVTDPQFDDVITYPTLVRMKPSLTIMGESLSHVFRKLGWQSFVLLHGSVEPWTEYEAAVHAAVDKTSIRMFAHHGVNATVSHNSLVSLFGQIKRDTQVIVFACPPAEVRQYMLAAHAAGLANGHYAFVQLDHQVYPESHIINNVLGSGQWKHGHGDDQIAREAYKYLIHIVLDPINEDDTTPAVRAPRNRYEEFARMAATVATVKKTEWQLPVGGKVDASALYLYDSVLVWAVLVDKLQAAGSPSRDGLLLAQRAQTFMADGATGYVSINSQRARDGKTFVLTMAPGGRFTPVQRLKFAGNTEYAVLNIRPIDERFRFMNKQSIPRPPPKSIVTTSMPTTTTTVATTTTSTTTIPASTQPPLKISPNNVPPPPPHDAVALLLARVQMLERKIKLHEAHSHEIIPDHTHTPAPAMPHTHTIPYHPNTPPTAHKQLDARHIGSLVGPHQFANNPHIPQQNNMSPASSQPVVFQQTPQQRVHHRIQHRPIINQPPQQVNQHRPGIQQPPQPVNHPRQNKYQSPHPSRINQLVPQPNPPITNADFNSGPIPRMIANPQVFNLPDGHSTQATVIARNPNMPAQQYPQQQQWPISHSQQHQPQQREWHNQQTGQQINQASTAIQNQQQQQQWRQEQNQQKQQNNQASVNLQVQQQQQQQTQQQQHKNKTRTITIQTQTRQIARPRNNKKNQKRQNPNQNTKGNHQRSQSQSQQQAQQAPGSQLTDAYLDRISAQVVDTLTGRILGTENNTNSEQQRAFSDLLANEENPAGLLLGLTLATRNQQARQPPQGSSAGMYNDPLNAFLDPWGLIMGASSSTDPWAGVSGPWWGEG